MTEQLEEEEAAPDAVFDKQDKPVDYHPKVGVRHRQWNKVEGFIGAPESGKTERIVRRALELQSQYRCYVIAHDVGWKIPETLHDGTVTGVTVATQHRNVDEARVAMAKDGRGIHCVSSSSALPVLAFCRELGQRSIARGRGWGFPILFIVDEVVTSRLADRKWLSDDMRELICDRRHAHVAVLWGVQSVRFVNPAVIALSTRVWCTRISDEFSHKHLVECGLQEGFVDQLATLQQYEFASTKVG